MELSFVLEYFFTHLKAAYYDFTPISCWLARAVCCTVKHVTLPPAIAEHTRPFLAINYWVEHLGNFPVFITVVYVIALNTACCNPALECTLSEFWIFQVPSLGPFKSDLMRDDNRAIYEMARQFAIACFLAKEELRAVHEQESYAH